MTAGRYVALGDSFTEGVGDPDPLLPNGVRGWADRVAERLAKAEPGWQYANLAIRSKRLRHVLTEQLEPALAFAPTLVTLYAGGNDVMDAGTTMTQVLTQYEALVSRLVASGALVVLFTGYDVPLPPPLMIFRRRNHVYNDGVREIAERYGCLLIDYWAFDGFDDRRFWAADRMHLSKAGHKLLASRVLDALEVPHSLSIRDRGRTARPTIREWERLQRHWFHQWVVPLVGRKLRGITLGDLLLPRWPTLVDVPPKGGLRKVAKRARGGEWP